MLKLLWNLDTKKYRLWIRWIHTYYIKHQRIGDCHVPKTSSWSFAKIIKCQSVFSSWGSWEEVQTTSGGFSTAKAYSKLLHGLLEVGWRHILIRNWATPRARFSCWLALRDRLSTLSRVARWNSQVSTMCRFCDHYVEDVQHILFSCEYARQVRTNLKTFAHIQFTNTGFEEEVAQMARLNSRKAPRTKFVVAIWTEMIYQIWLQRNCNIF